jgi:1,4-dihydroxy-6-naphthoate synthase
MLYKLFYPNQGQLEQVVFSDIMPRLQRGQADFGVCIHEGRFTWQASGLSCVVDLGQLWEQTTHSPLPLGGIIAQRRLSPAVLSQVQATIRESLEWARANPQQTLPTMRHHAQEFDDRVLLQHVELYVNDWTLDLGPVGAQALKQLNRIARQNGLLSAEAPTLEVWQP